MRNALIALVLLSGPTAALSAHPALCPDGVYVVDGLPLMPGASTTVPDTVTIDHSSVTVASGCAAVPARIVPHPKGGFVVRAHWDDCSGLGGNVRLRARLSLAGDPALQGKRRCVQANDR